jgi:hypothetical protein
MPIKSKMTKKQEQALFQKATEAMQLFAENPDALRGFLNALVVIGVERFWYEA